VTGPAKDEGEHPIPVGWRPVFSEIVHALARGDHHLAGIDSVTPVTEETARQIAGNIEDYGATLVDLTDETWDTSLAAWTGGHWDALVDLRTAEEGASDLALHAQVHEAGAGYRFKVEGVWVE
jgi:hypothetical protein